MNRQPKCVSLALTAFVLLGLAHSYPAVAQQPPTDQVALKASLTGAVNPRFVIPLQPEIRIGNFTAEGTSDLLGTVTYVETNTLQMGVDGKGLSVTDGKGVMTAANGDAVFVTYSGPVTLDTPAKSTAEFTFTIIGGRGRFLGATGSGLIHCATDPGQKTFTRVFDGTVTAPLVR
jgi:hypothetical protein